MSSARFVTGIDLGTTNTVVARASLDSGALSDVSVLQVLAPHETAPLPNLPSTAYLPAADELPPGAVRLPWHSDATHSDDVVVGAFARAQGAKVPGRVITSAKSWLSYAGVDRQAAILPWAGVDDVAKLSPVDVQARLLEHVRHSLEAQGARLADDDVVITVPASFDEVARELTLKAAERAGLGHARLLEEPQAALYDFLAHNQARLTAALSGVRLVLVVDVGGGTTDLTLVRVDENRGGPPTLSRIAVGDHVMLGGDNMDATLARAAEKDLTGTIGSLDAASWSTLVSSARMAKEALLSSSPPAEMGVSLVTRGKRLIGGNKVAMQQKDAVLSLLLDGFFPVVDANAVLDRRRAGLAELGLPYAQDTAVPRHVVSFLRRHKDTAAESGCVVVAGLPRPDAVLLNGGVFHSPAVRERFAHILSRWFGGPVPFLRVDDGSLDGALDRSVARGAAYAGLVRRGHGMRIEGGSARAYFVGVQGDDGAHKALCVAPLGQAEGSSLEVERVFSLLVGQPVGFPLYSSTSLHSRAGDLVDANDDALEALPPLSTVLTLPSELPVRIGAHRSDVGTLELSLQATPAALPRFALSFSTRTDAGVSNDAGRERGQLPTPPGLPKKAEEAKELVLGFFGNKSKDVDPKRVKDLRRDLEKVLGPREQWSTGLNRELFGVLLAGQKNRRRSPEHERMFFQLVGYTLRPGVGAPFDDWRITELWPLWSQGVQNVNEKATWASWFILWRRVAAGLSAEQQRAVADYLRPWVLEQGTGKKGQGPTPHGTDEMVRLYASLERIAATEKQELGDVVWKKLGRGGLTSAWALGRLGARQPLFGSAHDVIAPEVAVAWIERLLSKDLQQTEGALFALAQLARKTGDRGRDIDDATRAKVVARLQKAQAPAAHVQMVQELVVLSAEDEGAALGDALPAGLRL